MPKRSAVSAEMRNRLLTNREGKLTVAQWTDMISEPLVTLLLLTGPAIVILGPRALLFGWTTLMIGLLLLAAVLVMVLVRARRYARLPVYHATAYPHDSFESVWKFWKPPIMRSDSGEILRFVRRLAPNLRLQQGRPYLVYYLKDSEGLVLLSLAPADDPDAAQWQPGEAFTARLKQREGR